MFRKHKRILIGAAIFLAALTSLGVFTYNTGYWPVIHEFIYTPKALLQVRGSSIPQIEPQRPIEDILTPEEMVEDLQKLRSDLLAVHPNAAAGLPSDIESAFQKAVSKVVGEIRTVGEFYLLIAELMALFEDAHTTSRIQSEILPLTVKIIDGRFYVLPSPEIATTRLYKIVSVGGVPIEEIYQNTVKTISAENDYWRNYIFENTGLSRVNLTLLGAEIDNGLIEVIIEDDNEKITLLAGFRGLPQGSNQIFDYSINTEESYAHFILKSAEYSNAFKDFLDIMFKDIQDNNVENLILDLRGNAGGNLAIIDEFLSYIDVERYSTFQSATIRLSKEASRQKGYLGRKGVFQVPIKSSIENEKETSLSFDGDIYVLTDNGTFSTATSLATILSDNGLATLVGQPTGGMPTSFGDPIYFQLPNSKIHYRISHKKFTRANEEKRYVNSLYPDYEVIYTLNDYRAGRDLELQKAVELINLRSINNQ